MFERYTDAAKRAIFFARVEANHRNADCISPEYMLAGVIRETASTFADIAPLKELAVSLRAHMEMPHLPSTSLPYLRERDIPLDDGGKKVIAYAALEANRDRQYWIDCDHLLRGMLRFPNKASDALQQAGIALRSIRSAANLRRRNHPSAPAPRWGYAKIAIDRSRPWLVWLAVLVLILAFVLLLRLRGPV